MKNIWSVFRTDLMRIRNNVIALIVIMGILVVPCLYAWFNIAASWDPYGNTGNLKVAVASTDEGYEGSLISIRLNLGDDVLSALRENTQLNWVFTSEEKALDGVNSGEYYAAIVIPEDFSRNLMSLFSDELSQPEIIYYSNAKENAIAPKVTDKGATAIQNQINEVFIETISGTAMTALQSVANVADESGSETITANLTSNLNQISNDLSAAAATLNSFSRMTGSAQQLLDSTATFLQQASSRSDKTSETLRESGDALRGLQGTIAGATSGINEALSSGATFYQDVSSALDSAFDTQGRDAETVAGTLDTITDRINAILSSYTSLRDAINSIGEAHPELSPATGNLVGKMNDSIAVQTRLRDRLVTTAASLRSTSADIAAYKDELDDLIAQSAAAIQKVQSDYETNVKDSLNNLVDSLGGADGTLSTLLTQLGQNTKDVTELTDSASSDLTHLKETLDASYTLLSKASDQVGSTSGKLDQMQQSGDFTMLETLLGESAQDLSSFLAAPVSLKTKELYPIANYGSSMAPFYSTLSIWIGGIVLVAMLSVTVPESDTKSFKDRKPYQIYLGRSLIFTVLGLLQSTLICLGDLFYLGIQCEHPVLFLIAGWFTSIVYVNIIYTLTVSFGDIGKAVSVVLLVMQVAGSGGTFPIEVAPAFFRCVYPLLPFTHSMGAMRETIGGMYGATYQAELGKLALFLALSLFLGLFLRKPIIKVNHKFGEMLEETKLM